MLKQIHNYKWIGWRWFAIIWLLIITILFFLPASAFPKETWLSKIHFDKLVHFGFFAVLLFLWRFYLPYNYSYRDFILIFFAIAYAFLVEVVQHNFVSNRAFDLYDVVADIVGAAGGIISWRLWYKKDKPL